MRGTSVTGSLNLDPPISLSKWLMGVRARRRAEGMVRTLAPLPEAFQIGFAIFIPFLVIDIVVAAVLMSMGMMMVTPSIFSLPFKIMLFVLVDGWHLLLGSLAQSFVQ